MDLPGEYMTDYLGKVNFYRIGGYRIDDGKLKRVVVNVKDLKINETGQPYDYITEYMEMMYANLETASEDWLKMKMDNNQI